MGERIIVRAILTYVQSMSSVPTSVSDYLDERNWNAFAGNTLTACRLTGFRYVFFFFMKKENVSPV